MDDDSEKKKAKGTKMCIIKKGFMFENYKPMPLILLILKQK